jgi:hypothetical protein
MSSSGIYTPVRTSQETHYVSTRVPNRLMLCKIWSFHGSGYEECRLLGYRNSVHTSQETYFFSARETSRKILCKIWEVQGGDCEEYRFMWCDITLLLIKLAFEAHYDVLCCVFLMLGTANFVLSSLIIVTLMTEAIVSSETSGLTRAARRHIPQDGILYYLLVF